MATTQVLQDWVTQLPASQQHLLLAAACQSSGNDTRIADYPLLFRGLIFNPTRGMPRYLTPDEAAWPMDRDVEQVARAKSYGDILKLMSALAIIGYKHPVDAIRQPALAAYCWWCDFSRVKPENEDAFDLRFN